MTTAAERIEATRQVAMANLDIEGTFDTRVIAAHAARAQAYALVYLGDRLGEIAQEMREGRKR